MEITADVKCYYCGHISGQIVGRRGETLRPDSFVPRSGYTGLEFKPSERLRCERCLGPVFLEDATPFNAPGLTGRPGRNANQKRRVKAA